MKKINKYLLLISCFIFAFFVSSYEVSAKETTLYSNSSQVKGCTKDEQEYGSSSSNFWKIMCAPYTIVTGKEDDSSKYTFSRANHNFTFEYDYEIEFNIAEANIRDGTQYVNRFIGINSPTTITYTDIDIGTYYVFPETFIAYRYAPLSGKFTQITSFSSDTSGSYSIDTNGIYKLETYVEGGGTTYATYLVYENDFYYSSLRSITYDSDTQSMQYVAKVNTPENLTLTQCGDLTIKIVSTSSDVLNCNVTYGDVQGEYDIVVETTSQLTSGKNRTTTLLFKGATMSATISYDSALPVLVDELITYYPTALPVEEFAIQYNDEALELPESTIAVFEYQDDSATEIKLNGKNCSVVGFKVTCSIDKNSGDTLVYTLVDAYGNETIVEHFDISYGDLSGFDVNELRSYIEINDNVITFTNLDEYSDFDRICLFYGTEISEYICANTTSELSVTSDKYYSGPISVVLTDVWMNIIKFSYDEVTLDSGYDPSIYEVNNIVGDLVYKHDVTNEVKDLIELACAGESECLSTVKVYGKYGVTEEVLSNSSSISTLKLPTYLEMLNKGFTNKACAFQRCNETIEVYVSYVVGGLKQKLAAKYSYIDTLPQITDQIDDYQLNRRYDFSDLDVSNFITMRELFATPLGVTLVDGDGTTYEGIITSRFVRYIDRNGNVNKLNNLPYTYIGGKKAFGYYLLEGSVKLTKNVTTGTSISGDVYGKSFFVNVELADTKKPVLTLIGDSSMKLKQYDVFKDPEFKCVDASTCTMSTKYYYENENNEVDKVDTTIPGTYIIKYSAMDADGNVSTLTRTVYVESVNAMNGTAIIIIVVVILVFVGSIAIAIWFEIKRRREEI